MDFLLTRADGSPGHVINAHINLPARGWNITVSCQYISVDGQTNQRNTNTPQWLINTRAGICYFWYKMFCSQHRTTHVGKLLFFSDRIKPESYCSHCNGVTATASVIDTERQWHLISGVWRQQDLTHLFTVCEMCVRVDKSLATETTSTSAEVIHLEGRGEKCVFLHLCSISSTIFSVFFF